MGMNNLPKIVTRQRRGCDLNPGPSALESSTLTTRLPSHPSREKVDKIPRCDYWCQILSTVTVPSYHFCARCRLSMNCVPGSVDMQHFQSPRHISSLWRHFRYGRLQYWNKWSRFQVFRPPPVSPCSIWAGQRHDVLGLSVRLCVRALGRGIRTGLSSTSSCSSIIFLSPYICLQFVQKQAG